MKTLRGIDSGNIYTLRLTEGGPVKRYKSIPDAIADILTFPDLSPSKESKMVFEGNIVAAENEVAGKIRDECPECGHFSMIRKGGCKFCLNCNYEIC